MAEEIDKGDLQQRGLKLDNAADGKAYTKTILAATLTLQGTKGIGPCSSKIRFIVTNRQLMLPISAFVAIAAASPFFRTHNIVSYQQGLAEVPWTERNLLSIEGVDILDKEEVREGSFIKLYDSALSEQTNGRDAPVLYGQIIRFIGFDITYVTTSIRIFAFHRYATQGPTPYYPPRMSSTGKHHYSQAIILLCRERCRINPVTTVVEYKSAELTNQRSIITHIDKGLIEWGMRREWDEVRNWEHPMEVHIKFVGDRGCWGQKENEIDGRGDLF